MYLVNVGNDRNGLVLNTLAQDTVVFGDMHIQCLVIGRHTCSMYDFFVMVPLALLCLVG
jgi:hypothetical protein